MTDETADTVLTVRVGAATDVGRLREHNEDSHHAGGAVFVVADGMGGHAAGEVASEIATETLAELSSRAPRLTADDLATTLQLANERILQGASDNPDQRGMATTVTGLAMVDQDGPRWAVFNVGDSRVYRADAEQLTQLTTDHSEVQELLDRGLITPAEAARHPMRNVITRSLGIEQVVRADIWVLDPHPGERFVICSDGLTNELSDADIRSLVARHDDPQQAAAALVTAAVDAGGRDNVTVIVVQTCVRAAASAAPAEPTTPVTPRGD